MEKSKELKPCPFCGRSASCFVEEFYYGYSGVYYEYRIECDYCDCSITSSTEEGAIKNWNE